VKRILDCGLRIAECLFLAILLLGGVGCEDQVKREPRVAIDKVKGDGRVRGVVRFEGTPPVMRTIENRPCHPAAEPIAEEHVVVGASGGLKNVFVTVESPALPKVDGSPLPPAVLDQVSCRYVPHAVGVCVGQTLRVRTSDPGTMHNVHYNPSGNESRNFAMTGAGQEKAVTFTAPEFIRVACDVHPWMSAHVGVFDTPFFAVTDDKGEFEILNLPSGRYKLVAWHERYGKLESDVSVERSAVTTELLYKAP
jgi:plastocyanin